MYCMGHLIHQKASLGLLRLLGLLGLLELLGLLGLFKNDKHAIPGRASASCAVYSGLQS